MATAIEIKVAVGELIDKITILQIKKAQINDPEKQKNVQVELDALSATRQTLPDSDTLHTLEQKLKQINQTLWDIEDDIRLCEANSQFDNKFIHLARSVYITNDQRCAIKRDINKLFDSEIIEEKSYQNYLNKEQLVDDESLV